MNVENCYQLERDKLLVFVVIGADGKNMSYLKREGEIV